MPPSAAACSTLENLLATYHGVLIKSPQPRCTVGGTATLYRCHGRLLANAMEKSKYNHQAIQEHLDDHVGTGGRRTAMTMSAASRQACQADLCGAVEGQLFNHPFSQRGSQPTIHNRRADIVSSRRRHIRPFGSLGYLLVLIASFWVIPASAVFIDFDNCLSESYQNGETGQPKQLQFVPLFMNAVFNTTDPSHNLQVIVWGNVTGSGPENLVGNLPPWNDSYWGSNSTAQGGKILDVPNEDSTNPKITTLSNKVDVLTYEPYDHSEAFCGNLVNATCPLAPAFNASA